MKSFIAIMKKNYHILFFAAFAALTGLSFLYIAPKAEAAFLAARASEGFFDAVSYGADALGEGIVTSFLYTLLAVCPEFVWQALDFLLIIITVALAASIPSGKTGTDSERWERTCAALVFTAALFAVIDKSILYNAVFSISGLVHCVLPTALILAFYRLAGSGEDDRSSGNGESSGSSGSKEGSRNAGGSMSGALAVWGAPVAAVVISMLSYEAALAAFVICVFVFAKALGQKTQSMSRTISLAASLAILFASSVLFFLRIAGFPQGMSRLWILRNFFASILSYGGFFTPIMLFMIFTATAALCCDIIPAVSSGAKLSGSLVLRLALCLLSAATFVVLILHSPLIPAVLIPGKLIFVLFCVTSVFAVIVLASDMRAGTDRTSLPFGLAAAVALFATLVTYSFGWESYYIPTILVAVVLAGLFARVRLNRAATVIAAGLAALYAALNTVSRPHFVGVAAIILAGVILQTSPLFRKHRIFESVAVLFVFILFFLTNRWL